MGIIKIVHINHENGKQHGNVKNFHNSVLSVSLL